MNVFSLYTAVRHRCTCLLQCSDSYCLDLDTGAMVRPLYCISATNGSHMPLSMCDVNNRPQDKRRCHMPTCKPRWLETDWTPVSDSDDRICKRRMIKVLYCWTTAVIICMTSLKCSMIQCSRSCGGTGYRTRSLLCVWIPNKGPANGQCDGLARPDVIMRCATSPCPQTDGTIVDCRQIESTEPS